MTVTKRVNDFFNGEKIDRLPAMEWAPWWDLTLDRWKSEGLDCDGDYMDIAKGFGIDPSIQLYISNHHGDCPSFREGGFITNEQEYEKIKPYIFQKRFVYDMAEQLKSIATRREQDKNFICWLTVEGFFWYPRVLFGIEEHLYSFYDHPELYHKICEDMVEYYKFALDEVTRYIKPDFMTFAEDMSYNLGSMISKDLFDEFLKPYYDELIPYIHAKNIKLIIDSDGDITQLIPWLTACNVDGFLPLERQAGVDICKLTEDFPDLYFIGGFDKMVMKFGEDAMRKEFERILPAMKKGRYLASVDHQTPPDVSVENYRIYCRLLKEYCGKAV